MKLLGGSPMTLAFERELNRSHGAIALEGGQSR